LQVLKESKKERNKENKRGRESGKKRCSERNCRKEGVGKKEVTRAIKDNISERNT
jgi:hypothetical protein